MSALAYADKTTLAGAAEAPAKVARPGFWSRVLDAIVEGRRREVERQVEAYLIRNRLTRPTRSKGPEEAWKGPADALPF